MRGSYCAFGIGW